VFSLSTSKFWGPIPQRIPGLSDCSDVFLKLSELLLISCFQALGLFKRFQVINLALQAIRVTSGEFLDALSLELSFGFLNGPRLFGFPGRLGRVD
jgi:hypothetical protein